MSYEFKGYQWEELAECWGLTVEEKVVGVRKSLDERTMKVVNKSNVTTMETIEVSHRINGMNMKFEVTNYNEVLAEKVKRYIRSNYDGEDNFINKQMRLDLVNFLTALADADEGQGYNHPVYRGIAAIEHDRTMGKWVIHNLENLWT